MWEFLFTYQKQSWKEKGKLKAASVSATCQSGPTHSYNLPLFLGSYHSFLYAASKAPHFWCSCIALQYVEEALVKPTGTLSKFCPSTYSKGRFHWSLGLSNTHSELTWATCRIEEQSPSLTYRSSIAQGDFLTSCLLLNKDCTFCLFLHIVR